MKSKKFNRFSPEGRERQLREIFIDKSAKSGAMRLALA
jgi:hypothetical protein